MKKLNSESIIILMEFVKKSFDSNMIYVIDIMIDWIKENQDEIRKLKGGN